MRSPRSAGHRSPSTPQASGERGFSLVEALIAAVLLTVALVALAELLAVSVRMHQLGRNTTTATRLAQDKFEELMKLSFATSPAIQVNGADTLSSNVANYFDNPGGGFRRRWQVAPGPGGNAQLRTVTVRVLPDATDARVVGDLTVTMVIRSW